MPRHTRGPLAQYFDLNVPIGPLPNRRQKAEEESRRKEQSDHNTAFRAQERAAFKAKFGEDLGAYALAYATREEAKAHRARFVIVGMQNVKVDDLRQLFAKTLADSLSALPEAERADWLCEFFKETDRVASY